jgi:ubiquinone/menaquinone biosynthesis C-methylase UbiE
MEMLDRIIKAKVVEHFEKTEEYRQRRGFVHPEFDPLILRFVKDTIRDPEEVRILEVGGGSGYMLDLIASETGTEHLYNCELVPKVYRNQVNEKITLIGGDALNLPFKSNIFDYVIIKNLLHHLVSSTRGRSKKNAEIAVEELIRVTKDEGYIIILEQYNEHRFFSFVIFYLTLFFSMFGISFKSFGWGENVVVSFLTPAEIEEILVRSDITIVLNRKNRLSVPKKWKYTLFMSNVGRMLIIARINKIDS